MFDGNLTNPNLENYYECWVTFFFFLLHRIQTHNERTSTESNLVTAQSTAHGPPEDGRKYGPKHVGATLLKCFNMLFKCFKY